MALYDLADQAAPLPSQLVFDSSLLLALRPGDDNPQAAVAQAFVVACVHGSRDLR